MERGGIRVGEKVRREREKEMGGWEEEV